VLLCVRVLTPTRACCVLPAWVCVRAAAESIPSALVEQLALGGRMIIPVGRHGWNQVRPSTSDDERAAQRSMHACMRQQLRQQLQQQQRAADRLSGALRRGAQVLMRVDKDASGHVTQHELMGVQYVPLVHTGKRPPRAEEHAAGTAVTAREE
jgi:hypothetical protein